MAGVSFVEKLESSLLSPACLTPSPEPSLPALPYPSPEPALPYPLSWAQPTCLALPPLLSPAYLVDTVSYLAYSTRLQFMNAFLALPQRLLASLYAQYYRPLPRPTDV